MRVSNIYIAIICSISSVAFGQDGGDIGTEEITITKERQVSVQKANRVFEKIPPVQNEKSETSVEYEFYERKPKGIQEVAFEPNIVSPDAIKKTNTNRIGYPNYFKVGGGNYGRIYAETFINSPQNQNLVFGVHALHNSARRGPIQGENSGNANTEIEVMGKYHSGSYELKADASWNRRNYYFYGYDTTIVDLEQDQIRQRLNIFDIGVAIENTKPKAAVDYKLSTQFRHLQDFYQEKEIDWGTHFTAYFPIIKNKVTAVVDAQAYLTEQSSNFEENPTKRRNLFRVEPSFNLDFNAFNAKIGFKAVNEFDQVKGINATRGFPTVTLTYKTQGLYYFFAGFDGDVIRNTLGKFYNENPWIKSQVNLSNTVKEQEYFIGSRGDISTSGLSYNFKASYGKYNGLYFYNIYDAYDGPIGVRRFEVYYDNNSTDFANVSLELNYQALDFWQTNLSADYFYYETVDLQEAYHRPNFEARLGNTFKVSDKIVSNLDLYFLSNTIGTDPFRFEDIAIPAIIDVNAEITYLFSEQFSAFVKLNNLVGQNYQRFLYYPQMGLNFVAGINVSL